MAIERHPQQAPGIEGVGTLRTTLGLRHGTEGGDIKAEDIIEEHVNVPLERRVTRLVVGSGDDRIVVRHDLNREQNGTRIYAEVESLDERLEARAVLVRPRAN